MRQRQILELLLFVLLLGARSSWVQMVDQKQVYGAYVKHDVNSWKRVIDHIHAEPSKSYARIVELVEYEYGYITECILYDKNSEAERCLKHYKAHVDYLIGCDCKTAEMTAYLSTYYTYRISISWLRAALVGNKSISLMNRSIKIDKQNAIGLIQRGDAWHLAPAFSKGDTKKGAIDHFLQTGRTVVSQGRSEGSWLYLSLLIQITECYIGIGEQTQAEAWYRKVISLESRLTWAPDSKYLENKQKHGQQ